MSIKGNAKSFVELRGSLSLPKAIHGKSAYELAVMHGFEGTEAEWVHYLRYAKDGLTPYIGVNGHWWIGTQDTGLHAEGKDGTNGLTPYIGENGDWWIGEADTGVIAGTPKYMCGTALMYEGETKLAPNKVYFLIEGDDDIPLTYLSAVASGTEDIEVGGTALEVGTVYFKHDEATDEPTTVTFTIDGSSYTVPYGTTWQDLLSEYEENMTPESVFSEELYDNGSGYVCFQVSDCVLTNSNGYVTLDAVIEPTAYWDSGMMASDIDTPSTVTFTVFHESDLGSIDLTTTVSKGTTWREWCNTSYDEDLGDYNWVVNGGNVVNYVFVMYLIDGNGNRVSADSEIVAGTYGLAE